MLHKGQNLEPLLWVLGGVFAAGPSQHGPSALRMSWREGHWGPSGLSLPSLGWSLFVGRGCVEEGDPPTFWSLSPEIQAFQLRVRGNEQYWWLALLVRYCVP